MDFSTSSSPTVSLNKSCQVERDSKKKITDNTMLLVLKIPPSADCRPDNKTRCIVFYSDLIYLRLVVRYIRLQHAGAAAPCRSVLGKVIWFPIVHLHLLALSSFTQFKRISYSAHTLVEVVFLHRVQFDFLWYISSYWSSFPSPSSRLFIIVCFHLLK